MKRLTSILAVLLALVCLLTACSSDSGTVSGSTSYIGVSGTSTTSTTSPVTTTTGSTATTLPNSVAQKTKTIMVYMVGSDLESTYGAASRDILEMLNSGVDTTKTNLLIYTGGTMEWAISDIPADKNCIYRLDGEDFNLVKQYNSKNMGVSTTLAEFLSFGVNNYKADEYGLILWDHGGGPMLGYGLDENYNDMLQMNELETAMSAAGFGGGRKLEFIGFDACLMGTVEVAWSFKDYANYLIASQETEPGWGWDYKFLKYLDYYDGGENIGRSIIDFYFADSEKRFKEDPSSWAELTLSCVDLSKVYAVETSLNTLFERVDSNILEGYFAKASQLRRNVKSFGKFSSGNSYDLIDMSHMASLLSADYGTEANQLMTDLGKLVTYSRTNVNNASGISIYHPYDNARYMNSWINTFNGFGFAKNYARYISNFSNMLSNPSSDSWKLFGTTKGTAEMNRSGNELSVQLTEEQLQNYAGSSYCILRKIADDEYAIVFVGNDTTLDASTGLLSASYDNKAVFAINDSTGEKSYFPIMMNQIDDGSGEQKYNVSAMFWYIGEDLDIRLDAVYWQFRLDNGTPQSLGAYLLNSSDDSILPQKQLLNYKDYTVVTFLNLAVAPRYGADGKVLPLSEWNFDSSYSYGTEYSVDDESFHFECREIDDKENYYVMFIVNDIQGNQYACDMFSLAG